MFAFTVNFSYKDSNLLHVLLQNFKISIMLQDDHVAAPPKTINSLTEGNLKAFDTIAEDGARTNGKPHVVEVNGNGQERNSQVRNMT